MQAIANKARTNKKHKFQNLCGFLTEWFLIGSFRMLNRSSSSGIDKVTVRDFERNLTGNIKELLTKLKEKRYRANLIRRVYIPKGNGKMRALGLPSTEDKILQMAVHRLLSQIYEEDFLPCSFGYRRGKGAKDAIAALTHEVNFGRYTYIVEADIRGFFDNINHDWLLRMLKERIGDRVIIRLIEKWLRAGILDRDGKVIHPLSGTPQGGIISPLLANIYLHYGCFYKSAMYPTLRHINRKLCLWAMRKYKKLKCHRRRAEHRLGDIAKKYPGMFPHWKLGIRPMVG